MDEINLPLNDQEWFGISLYPDKEFIDDNRGKATVNTLLGDTNEVYFGKPYIKKLDRAYYSDVQAGEELFLVHFSVSFRPANECEFVRSTIQVTIKDRDEKYKSSAVVVDVFPSNIFMPETFKKTISISPQLKIDLSKIAQIEASAIKIENNREYIVYQPSLVAFGKGTSVAGWDFEKSLSHSVRGIKDLYLLIRRRKSTPLQVGFELRNCFVQTNIGKIPLSTMFLSGTGDKILEDKYVIIE